MPSRIATSLMFQGAAEAAMTFYVSLLEGSAVASIKRYGPEGPGAEGSVIVARFTLAGHAMMCQDSPVAHNFGFTPSASLYFDCADEAEFDRLTAALSEGGEWLMPPDDYGFSKRFGWCNDRFGVSWQISLA